LPIARQGFWRALLMSGKSFIRNNPPLPDYTHLKVKSRQEAAAHGLNYSVHHINGL